MCFFWWNIKWMKNCKFLLHSQDLCTNFWSTFRNKIMTTSPLCSDTQCISFEKFSLIGTISLLMEKNLIPVIDEQNSSTAPNDKIWILDGHCRLALVILCLAVPPILSQGTFSWLVAKKDQLASIFKLILWRHRLMKFLTFCIVQDNHHYSTQLCWHLKVYLLYN